MKTELFLGLVAVLLFAFAASTPLWVREVGGTEIVSVAPQVVVGLISLVFATLSIVGASIFFLLNREADRRRQDLNREAKEMEARIRNEIQARDEVVYASVYSFMAYLEYSKTWTDANFSWSIQHNPRFQEMVSFSTLHAEHAFDQAKSTMEEGNATRVDTVNHLAYQLATQYLLRGDEKDRLRAASLADELRKYTADFPDYWETLAWVNMICYPEDSGKRAEGQRIIEGLLRRDELPRYWRELERQKISNLFKLELPQL